ncbi:MAG: glycosyltransferase [Acidobacteriota bacterium]
MTNRINEPPVKSPPPAAAARGDGTVAELRQQVARDAASLRARDEELESLSRQILVLEEELNAVHGSKMWKLWMVYIAVARVIQKILLSPVFLVEKVFRRPGLSARFEAAAKRRIRWFSKAVRVVLRRSKILLLRLLLAVPHACGWIYMWFYARREQRQALERRRQAVAEGTLAGLELRMAPPPPRPASPARRPRVLLVSPYALYPTDHGGAVRIFHLLREASAEVDLHVVVFSRDDDNSAQREALAPYCTSLHFHRWQPSLKADFWGLTPPGAQLFRSADVTERLQSLVSAYDIDILQLEFTELGQYATRVAVPKTVLTEIDITFRSRSRRRAAGFHRRYIHDRVFGTSRGDWMRLFRYEVAVCEGVDQIHVMSEDDGRYLASFMADGSRRVRVVPNAVDTERIRPGAGAERSEEVLFVGNFQHLPNVDAVDFLLDEVWPRLLALRPESRLTVVGVAPPPHILERDGRDGVTVAGEVPDVLPYYISHRVMIAPIRAGSGTRLKILEAFSAGLPVVSTTVGAEGIHCRDDEHLLLGAGAEELAEGLHRVLGDRELAERLASAGRELVEASYDWRASARSQVDSWWELMPEPVRLGAAAGAPAEEPDTGEGPPEISVVLPTRNGGPLLEETLAAIFEQKVERSFEVICVDSGSGADDLRRMQRFPIRLIAIDPAEFNHGLTRDLGAREAHGQVLVFLNQDATPAHRHWLARITEPLFSGDREIAGVQGAIQERPEPAERFYWDSCGERFYFTRESDRWIERFDGIGFSTVNAALRHDVWQRHPFGEALIMEDKKWQREVVEAGYRLEVRPEAVVAHTHTYDLRTLSRRCESEGYGWRLLDEPYSLFDVLRDLSQPKMYADWISGLFQGRIRSPAEFFFPWLRPLMLYRGNRWSRGVKL